MDRMWRGEVGSRNVTPGTKLSLVLLEEHPGRSAGASKELARQALALEVSGHPGTVACARQFQMAGDWGSPGLAACDMLVGLRSWASLGASVGLSNLCLARNARDAFQAPGITWSKTASSFGVLVCCPKDALTTQRMQKPKYLLLG